MAIFDAGSVTLFQQTSAPTGWTKITVHNNASLRVVSGTASSGGSVDFTTLFSLNTFTSAPFPMDPVGATTLAVPNIAPHTHIHPPTATLRSIPGSPSGRTTGSPPPLINRYRFPPAPTVGNTGISAGTGPGSHDHSVTFTATGQVGDMRIKYTDVILASKD